MQCSTPAHVVATRERTTPSFISRLAAIILGSIAVGVGVGCSGAEDNAYSGSDSALTNVRDAGNEFGLANKQMEILRERLAAEQSEVAPVLGDVDLQRFGAAFNRQRSYVAVHNRVAKASIAIEAILGRVVLSENPDPRAFFATVGDWNYSLAKFYDDRARQASSPAPLGAFSFAIDLLNSAPLRQIFGKSDVDVVTEILNPALPTVAAHRVIETQSADSAVASLLTELRKIRGLADKAQLVLSTLQNTAGQLQRFSSLADNTDLISTSMAPGLKAADAVIALFAITDAALKNDVSTIMKSIPGWVGTFADAANVYRKFILGAEELGFLKNIANVTGKIGAGIGIVTLIATGTLATMSLEDKRYYFFLAADGLSLASTLTGLALSVVTATALGPISFGLGIGALVLKSYAQYKNDAEEQVARTDDKRKFLNILELDGFDLDTIDLIVTTDAERLIELKTLANLGPKQVLDYLHTSWTLRTSAKSGGVPLGDIGSVESLFELSTTEAEALLKDVGGRASSPEAFDQRLFYLAAALRLPPASKSGIIDRLTQEGQDPSAPDSYRSAITAAVAYLKPFASQRGT